MNAPSMNDIHSGHGMHDGHHDHGIVSGLFRWLSDFAHGKARHTPGTRADAQPGSTTGQQAASSRGDPLDQHVWWGGT